MKLKNRNIDYYGVTHQKEIFTVQDIGKSQMDKNVKF